MQHAKFVPLMIAGLVLASCNSSPAPSAPETVSAPEAASVPESSSTLLQAQGLTAPWFLGQWYCVGQDRQYRLLDWKWIGAVGFSDATGTYSYMTHFFEVVMTSFNAQGWPQTPTKLSYSSPEYEHSPQKFIEIRPTSQNSFTRWTFSPLPDGTMGVVRDRLFSDPYRQKCFRKQQDAIAYANQWGGK